jgi:hypothetical protein
VKIKDAQPRVNNPAVIAEENISKKFGRSHNVFSATTNSAY